MELKSDKATEKVGAVQLGLVILSLAAVTALLADAVSALPNEVSRTIQFFDFGVCLLLAGDFFWRLHRAPVKSDFMRTGWVDLVACIPNVDFLRGARLVRVFRIIRILRGIRAGHRAFQIIRENRAKGALASALTAMVLLVTFSSMAILVAEQGGDANIKTAEDAIWWSVTTITTVGYGDRFPVSAEGRLIAMALMLCGVGLFGVLSGFVASFLLGKQETEGGAELKEVMARLDRIEAQLAANSGRGVTEKPSEQSSIGL